ncbi:DUF805 domain-containing protein [Dyadobacter fermentans]|uniref:DUF805 domain-containing protein n=1 Tax=Dyadobacter fermentans TaxID=94254 RepID=UPI001CBCA1F9|nr:DUF805 domain-containing protein [Dyadobacter fermentans]MBZ1363036.1 DUF805 domain-containing protein [Dyadobacter fermentans]
MFKKPFSFDGRIGRTEYCLSYFGYFAALMVLELVSFKSEVGILFSFVCAIPIFWFALAQGAKRCHDRNNIGWFQIIPGYFFWMAFAPGDPGENDFGPSPKQSAELHA